MIEVLVSVLVLSVGLLGIALVQTRALANNNSSMGRSMATVATYSILEAIRADRANLPDYSDISVDGGSCETGGSTLHEQQINAWCKELADTLGAVDTTIGTVSCDDDDCTVTVQYDDSKVGVGGSSVQQVVTRTLL